MRIGSEIGRTWLCWQPGYPALLFSGRVAATCRNSYWRYRHDRVERSPPNPLDPYAVLGVPHDASPQLIKQTYRLRALELHPDAAKGPDDMKDPLAFIQLSAAYEILSDREKRKVYDEAWLRQQQPLHSAAGVEQPRPAAAGQSGSGAAWAREPWRQRSQTKQEQGGEGDSGTSQAGDRPAGPGAGAAPEATQVQPAGAVPDSDLMAWRYGVGSWMLARQQSPVATVQPQREDGTSLLQRYLRRRWQPLDTALQQALTHAYLGPRLDYLGPGQLPKYFEAEARSHPSSNEVLQLVSARTLLGTVTLLSGPQLLQVTRPGLELGGDVGSPNQFTAQVHQAHRLPSPISDSSESGKQQQQQQHLAVSDADLDLIFNRSFLRESKSIYDPSLYFNMPSAQDQERQAARTVQQLLAAHGSSSSGPQAAAGAAGGWPHDRVVCGGSRLRSKWRKQSQADAEVAASADSTATATAEAEGPETNNEQPAMVNRAGSDPIAGGMESGAMRPLHPDVSGSPANPTPTPGTPFSKAANPTLAPGTPSSKAANPTPYPGTPFSMAANPSPTPGNPSSKAANPTPNSGNPSRNAFPLGSECPPFDESGTQGGTSGHAAEPGSANHQHGQRQDQWGQLPVGLKRKENESPVQWHFHAETEGSQVLALHLHGRPSGFIAVREPAAAAAARSARSPEPGPGSWFGAGAGAGAGRLAAHADEGLSKSCRRVKILLHGQVVAGICGDAVLGPAGHHWAYLMRGGSIGLHTIHCFDMTTRKMRLLSRMTRTQLLPPATWLFPPRQTSHTGSSWYLEWGGYTRQGQSGWLHPSVYCFLASFATLDFEAQLHAGDGVSDSTSGTATGSTAAPNLPRTTGEPCRTTMERAGAAVPSNALHVNATAAANMKPASDPDPGCELPGTADSGAIGQKQGENSAPSPEFKQAWARTKMLLGLW